MAYKKKMVYANTSSYRRSQKRKRTPKGTKTTFAKRVKKVVMKAAELKRAPIAWNKIELFHNVFSASQNLHLNGQNFMPTVGSTQQGQRIGDQIDTIGWKVNCLFGQKGDRPNVSFRVMCYSVPKGGSITYDAVFKNVAQNVLLDEKNTDYTRVIMDKTFRPNQAGLGATGNDEYTFAKKFFIPHKKKYKFGAGEGVTTHNQHDLWFTCMVYDAFGSVITDNIAYMQVFTELQYKDL
jgi:hypothetical protein